MHKWTTSLALCDDEAGTETEKSWPLPLEEGESYPLVITPSIPVPNYSVVTQNYLDSPSDATLMQRQLSYGMYGARE